MAIPQKLISIITEDGEKLNINISSIATIDKALPDDGETDEDVANLCQINLKKHAPRPRVIIVNESIESLSKRLSDLGYLA